MVTLSKINVNNIVKGLVFGLPLATSIMVGFV